MILLTSASDELRVITGQAVPVDVHVSWFDISGTTITSGRKNTKITTATTTTIVPSPGAGTTRKIKLMTVRNVHASSPVDATIQHTDGTTAVEMPKVALAAGEYLLFTEALGFAGPL